MKKTQHTVNELEELFESVDNLAVDLEYLRDRVITAVKVGDNPTLTYPNDYFKDNLLTLTPATQSQDGIMSSIDKKVIDALTSSDYLSSISCSVINNEVKIVTNIMRWSEVLKTFSPYEFAVTIPKVTTSSPGIMSADDKSILNTLYSIGNNGYVTATGIKVDQGYDDFIEITFPYKLNQGDGWDTESLVLEIGAASGTQTGLMSIADKEKLDSLAQYDNTNVKSLLNGTTTVTRSTTQVTVTPHLQDGTSYGSFTLPAATTTSSGVMTSTFVNSLRTATTNITSHTNQIADILEQLNNLETPIRTLEITNSDLSVLDLGISDMDTALDKIDTIGGVYNVVINQSNQFYHVGFLIVSTVYSMSIHQTLITAIAPSGINNGSLSISYADMYILHRTFGVSYGTSPVLLNQWSDWENIIPIDDIKDIQDKIKAGNRNYFTQKTTIHAFNSSNSSIELANNEIYGDGNRLFTVLPDSGGKSWIRLNNVIDSNGWWTVSFDVKASTGSPVTFEVDICDRAGEETSTQAITLYSPRNWHRVSMSAYLNNYSANLMNFVDISKLAYVYWDFQNVKVEKGKFSTPWEAAPEDVSTPFIVDSNYIGGFGTGYQEGNLSSIFLESLQEAVNNQKPLFIKGSTTMLPLELVYKDATSLRFSCVRYDFSSNVESNVTPYIYNFILFTNSSMYQRYGRVGTPIQ